MQHIKLKDILLEIAKLGSGERFKAVEKNAAKHGASDPAAVAAAAGMKKYGKEKMEKMAHAHENTEIVKEDGLSTVKKTNPGPSSSMTTYERDANGIRQTTGSKTVSREEQRKKYDKYINPPGQPKIEHKNSSLLKHLVEDAYDEPDYQDDSGNPGMQLPEVDDMSQSPATKQAHELGLVSDGWGKWVDPKTGQTVARTIHGNLVKVEPHDDVGGGENDLEDLPSSKLGDIAKGIQSNDPPKDYLNKEIAQALEATAFPNTHEDVEEAIQSLHSFAYDIKSMSPKTKELYVDALEELGIAIEAQYDIGGGYTERMPIRDNKEYDKAFFNFLDSYNHDSDPSSNEDTNAI